MSLTDLILGEIQKKLKKWAKEPSEYEYAIDFVVENESVRRIWIPDATFLAITQGITQLDRLPELILNSLLPPDAEVEIKLRRIPQGNGQPDEVGLGGTIAGSLLRWFLRNKLLGDKL